MSGFPLPHSLRPAWPLTRLTPHGLGTILLLSGALAGCSPALDWREVRLGEAGLMAQFPCRPATQQRRVDLAGVSTTMTLSVCEAAGVTFAVSQADVVDPARLPAVMRFLRDAGHANLGAKAPGPTGAAWPVPGMTPQGEAGRWQISGRLPDGRELRSAMGLSSRGTVVIQASVAASSLPEAVQQPFFEGIRFSP